MRIMPFMRAGLVPALAVAAVFGGGSEIALLGAPAAPVSVSPRVESVELTWDEKEQRALKKLVKQVKKKSDWYKLDHDGFALRSQVSAEFTGELALYIQRLLSMYETLFPGRPTVGAVCEVIVHPDAGSFKNAVRAMQVTTGGTSGKAEFVWSWDVANKRIKSYGLHLVATPNQRLGDLPREELNGALLRCFNQRLVGQNPIVPWFEFGVTSWMGSFEPELGLDDNKEAHRASWSPPEPVDKKAKLPRKSLVLAPLLEADRGELASSAEKLDQCASFLEFLIQDKAGTKALRSAVDYMTKSRPVEIKKKTVIQLERGWLVHASGDASKSGGRGSD